MRLNKLKGCDKYCEIKRCERKVCLIAKPVLRTIVLVQTEKNTFSYF